ncbi:MAG: hypothetical protein ABSA92_08345 [Candidatus Bathyarchaeia archaeon]|jgi:hypothetical protein
MEIEEYRTFEMLEEAFERKEISRFVSFLASRELPLLSVYAVCMLEHVLNASCHHCVDY